MPARIDPLDAPDREGEAEARYRLAVEFYAIPDDSLAGAVVIDGGRPGLKSKVWTAGCMAMGEATNGFLVEFLRNIADDIEKTGHDPRRVS